MGERRAGSWREGAMEPSRAELVDLLFRRHYTALLRLGVVMLGSREAAEDAVQDAFVALHRHSPSLRDPEAAEAYLRSAVLNRCRSWVRRQVTQRAPRPLMLVREHQQSSRGLDGRSRRGRITGGGHAHVGPTSARGAGLPVRPRAVRRGDCPAARDQRGVGQGPYPSRIAGPTTADRGDPMSSIEERLAAGHRGSNRRSRRDRIRPAGCPRGSGRTLRQPAAAGPPSDRRRGSRRRRADPRLGIRRPPDAGWRRQDGTTCEPGAHEFRRPRRRTSSPEARPLPSSSKGSGAWTRAPCC